MSTQNFSVRFKLATKTAAEWATKESTIKPLQGEICFYSDTKKARLGDGINFLKDLEFLWLNEEEVIALVEALEKATEESIAEIQKILETKVPNTRKINGKSLDVDITLSPEDVKAIPVTEKGAAKGVATLDEYGYVPSSQLPAYVDDMVEGYYNVDGDKAFYEDPQFETAINPVSERIYVDISTSEYKAYRWAGTTAGYVEIFKSVTLGETSATAYSGDKGKAVTDKVNSILEGNHADEVVTYTNEMATVNALGGIAAGTTFSDMPITELLTKLLYPYIKPTISAKANPTNGGTFERGTAVEVTSIIATVTKKSENITKVEVFDGSTSLGVKVDGSTGTLTFPVDISVTVNGKKFTAKVTDATGTVVSANTGTFTFIDPYYYGVMDDGETFDKVNMTKLIQSKGNKELIFNSNNQKMVFAYPKSYGILKKIIDPNSFDVTSTWSYEEVNVTAIDGTSVAYYIYTSKLVTVDAYKMTFQY